MNYVHSLVQTCLLILEFTSLIAAEVLETEHSGRERSVLLVPIHVTLGTYCWFTT